MRSGLLAVGVILLVLGAIGYFVSPATAGTTTTGSVQTPTYLGSDNSYNTGYGTGNGLDLASTGDSSTSENSYNTGYGTGSGLDLATTDDSSTYSTGNGFDVANSGNDMNTTYRGSMYNTGYNTYNSGSYNSDSTYNTGYNTYNSRMTVQNSAYDDNSFTNTAFSSSMSYKDGVQVICIRMDADGNVYPAGNACADTTIMAAFKMGSGSSFVNTGNRVTNTNTYNTDSNTYNSGSMYNTGYSDNASNDTYNTGYNSNTGSDYNTGNDGSTFAATTGTYAQDVNNGNADTLNTGNGVNTSATTTTTSNSGVGGGSAVNTTTGVTGSSALRTLSIWAMVIGAVLTILGLVLPDPARVDVRARTAHGAAGRRVYEKEEVHTQSRK